LYHPHEPGTKRSGYSGPAEACVIAA
jgi:hypothetical protein